MGKSALSDPGALGTHAPGRAAGNGAAGQVRILVLVSGSGTNLQALFDAEKAGRFQSPAGRGVISLVVSDRPGAYALERARAAGVPALVAAPRTSGAAAGLSKTEKRRELSDRILERAWAEGIGLIILAGFLSILRGEILAEYAGRIINLHPALLPKYGGEGMYGDRVHRAVLSTGEAESGCTVHLVDGGADTGPVLLQKRVAVLRGDTAETLAERIRREEHIAIVEGAAIMIERIAKI
ncbi:MAG: phosphoribosylglycinamide formyltransferase [Treponema sp.]|jgi:phosphoribosylglycinamide formyltransferase-1|nr:phosphoribosylglycinamide formyltransferase [Treponema sp.]